MKADPSCLDNCLDGALLQHSCWTFINYSNRKLGAHSALLHLIIPTSPIFCPMNLFPAVTADVCGWHGGVTSRRFFTCSAQALAGSRPKIGGTAMVPATTPINRLAHSGTKPTRRVTTRAVLLQPH